MMLRERCLHRSSAISRRESRKLIAVEARAVKPANLAHQLL